VLSGKGRKVKVIVLGCKRKIGKFIQFIGCSSIVRGKGVRFLTVTIMPFRASEQDAGETSIDRMEENMCIFWEEERERESFVRGNKCGRGKSKKEMQGKVLHDRGGKKRIEEQTIYG